MLTKERVEDEEEEETLVRPDLPKLDEQGVEEASRAARHVSEEAAD